MRKLLYFMPSEISHYAAVIKAYPITPTYRLKNGILHIARFEESLCQNNTF